MARNPDHTSRFDARLTHPLSVLLLLVSLATLSYSNTLSSSFHFDDKATILENPRVKQIPSLDQIWSPRSIGVLTFAANYRFGRFEVFGYHFVNLLIHIANGFLVYTLVRLLFRTPGLRGQPPRQTAQRTNGIALLTALLFLVHPIQTQAVTYIAQRFTSLATLFYLLAVVCYLRYRLADRDASTRILWYASALGGTLLAMFTKEIGFTLPLVLLIVERVCFQTSDWKGWAPLVPFLLTLAVIPLVLQEHLLNVTRETTDISRLTYLLTQFRVLVTYLRLLILPVHQSVDYDHPLYHSFLDPPVFLSLGLLLILGAWALYALRQASSWRAAGLGLIWFFVTISVESSIIPIRDVLVEHRLYLPSVGFFLTGSVVAGHLLGHRRAPAMLATALAVAGLAIATYQRNAVWKDEITLWSNAVSANPENPRARTSLGAAYATHRRFDEAINEHVTALRIRPDYAEARNLLGLTYAKQQRFTEAAEELAAAIRLRPDFAEAHHNLGKVYVRQERLNEATREFSIALQLRPDLAEARYHLGNIYANTGRLSEAISELLTAIRLDPDYSDAHYSLGSIYAHQGRTDEAIGEFLTVLRIRPDFMPARQALNSLQPSPSVGAR